MFLFDIIVYWIAICCFTTCWLNDFRCWFVQGFGNSSLWALPSLVIVTNDILLCEPDMTWHDWHSFVIFQAWLTDSDVMMSVLFAWRRPEADDAEGKLEDAGKESLIHHQWSEVIGQWPRRFDLSSSTGFSWLWLWLNEQGLDLRADLCVQDSRFQQKSK